MNQAKTLRHSLGRLSALLALTAALTFGSTQLVRAQDGHAEHAPAPAEATTGHSEEAVGAATGEHGAAAPHGAEAAHGGGHAEGPRPVFEPEHGTWFNLPARTIFATPAQKQHMAEAEKRHAELQAKKNSGGKLTKEEEEELATGVHYVAKYDSYLYVPLLAIIIAVVFVSAAKKAKLRPEGKPHSLAGIIEAAVDGFQNYLIGVMGEPLARKYTPLIASFFFTILVSNWTGLIPGMLSPSAQPAIPIAMAIAAFFCVHIIAIKEAGIKSWFMHFVGEPIWLAPLNFPLHLVGELIKPLSLSLRLLCNVFGEEAVVATLAGLAVSMLPVWLPIPFQLPMLFLGTFFGFLQALVFSTLLSIYLSIFATHHDDHDAHNEHGHVEHIHEGGHQRIVAHPSEVTLA